MADIALATANLVNVVESIRQVEGVTGEAITAGAPCTLNTAGAVVNSDGNGAGALATVKGIATRTKATGEAITLIAEGRMDGWDFSSQAHGAKIYVSDTAGALADAAGTTSMIVGYVETARAAPLGTLDKILNINCPVSAA